jgi:hypothetical protein
VCFGLAVRIAAVEPLDPLVGFEVRPIQQGPDTRTTHRPSVPLRQGGDQVVETPAGDGAVVRRGLMGSHRHRLQTCGGGKAPRSTRARRILEAIRMIVTAPTPNNMAVTAQLVGRLQM